MIEILLFLALLLSLSDINMLRSYQRPLGNDAMAFVKLTILLQAIYRSAAHRL
jgi:hypothetical protein